MNTQNDTGFGPAVPAAALLFQAPQFVEPAVRESSPRRKADDLRDPPAMIDSSSSSSSDESKPRKSARSKSVKGRGGKKESSASDRTDVAARPSGAGAEETAKDLLVTDTADTKRRARTSSKGKANQEINNPDLVDEVSGAASVGDLAETETEDGEGSLRRRRRRSRSSGAEGAGETDPNDQVTALKGSTRLEAKRMRRREGRKEGRKRQSISESEFLARRESVDREMVVRHVNGLDQIAVMEDGLLVEHYVARRTQQSIVGNIYLARVQNVLPSMEAAFVDVGRGRNAVLYAGEVNWDALGMEGKPRRIETALKSGDTVLVQVTKDPIGHKGARLTSQITLAGRYLVLVPGSSMLGISRKLPDIERLRLKKVLREVVPEGSGVIVRTAAEGASEDQLREDVERLSKQWSDIQKKEQGTKKAPQLLRGEPELVVRVVRDIFNEDFGKLVVQGEETWATVSEYVAELSPELTARLEKWNSNDDLFQVKRIDQQLSKGMDRKVWLPSGGTLVIDRTEALTVVDVNTGKFIGSGGTLEETVTRNNLEAAEEIVRQLRLRDIGGIIIIDFVDMVLESNRELVLRRLVECLGRDRTRHQVTEITSLGLVQMTRKRVGEGLVEAFSTTCEACEGRGFIVHEHPVELTMDTVPNNRRRSGQDDRQSAGSRKSNELPEQALPVSHVGDEKVKTALSAIAAASTGNDTISGPVVAAKKTSPASTKTGRVTRKVSKIDEPKVALSASEVPIAELAPVVSKPRRRRVATSDDAVVASPIPEPAAVSVSPIQPVKTVEDITLPPAKPTRNSRTKKPVIEEQVPQVTVTVAEPKARRRVTSAVVSGKKALSAKEAVKDLFHE